MNGMQQGSNFAYTTGSDDYSGSFHWELPPRSALGQLSISTYFEFDDEAHVDLGFTHAEYLDNDNVTHHADYPDIDRVDAARTISVNRLTRIEWQMRVSNCVAWFLINLFFWDSVF